MSVEPELHGGPWVITGGNTGMGSVTARALARAGHAVDVAQVVLIGPLWSCYDCSRPLLPT